MDNITFRLDGIADLQAKFERAPARVMDALKSATSSAFDLLENVQAPRMMRARGANDRAADGVSVRTGTLRKMRRVIESSDSSIRASAGFTPIYAPGLESGATRTPTHSRYLAIPLPAARTGAGVSRYQSPRQLASGFRTPITVTSKSGKKRAKGVFSAGTFIKKPRSGGPGYVVFLRQGGNAPPIPMYRLVPNVKIPPLLGYFDTWARVRPRVEDLYSKALEAF